MAEETKSFHSLCRDIEEQFGALSSDLAALPSVCRDQKFHAASIMTGYAEDGKGTAKPKLDPDAPACLEPNYKESGPSLLEDAAYRKPQEILMAMSKCLIIANKDPNRPLETQRTYLKNNIRLSGGNLASDADVVDMCAFLEAHAPSQDGSYSQDMTRFRLVLLKRISSAIPALRESLEDIRNRIVQKGDIPAFDYHNLTAKQKETLRELYPKFSPAEDRLQDMIDSTKALEKSLREMTDGFWGSVGEGPKGEGFNSSPPSRIISLIDRAR